MSAKAVKRYQWDEIKKHDTESSKWVVIDQKVYDVSKWIKKHPGGSRVISHYLGADASEAFVAAPHEEVKVRKYLNSMYIGDVEQLKPTEAVEKRKHLMEDFEELRLRFKNKGYFNSSYLFFFGMLAQVLVLEALSYLNLCYFGATPLAILLSIAIYGTAQSQASWLQHDFGHHSVFETNRMNDYFHKFTMCFIKGASAHWWKHMHNQHHVKPNIIDKDPDVRLQPIFLVGETIPKEYGKQDNPILPYNHQHKYFFAIGPPLLFPVYFQLMSFRHIYTRRKVDDFLWVLAFWVKVLYLYVPILGLYGTLLFYFIVRMVESHWFTWVSQSNHLPMPIEPDQDEPWLALQVHATCDIEQSYFNDWFTGHLNFQIEHHLFPTMPRHNYNKCRPYVRELCQKYDIPYIEKPLGQAFADIIRCLRKSGQLWEAVYHAHHM